MKVLILGGHGFIGHHLGRRLIRDEHDVAVVDCHHQYGEYPDWEYAPVLRQRLDWLGDHDFFSGDVCDADFMHTVFERYQPEVVVDLATYPNAKMVKKNVVDATENMIAATAIALELCAKFQVRRFVLASSSMVYGDFGAYTGAPNESAVCDPLTLYGSYKLQCERMCKIWHREQGLEYVCLRPSALYGTRDMIVRVISKMAVAALTTGRITVNGPNNKLDFSWVTDVADAFFYAATDANTANEIYNCTRGNGRSILEAAELVRSRIPAEIECLEHDDFYPNRDTLDSGKLQTATPWKPRIDIEQGIPEYLDWLLAQEFVSKL
jgi:nucleoside-diphosphate-sugar epimerase